jgi:hypothetical protein
MSKLGLGSLLACDSSFFLLVPFFCFREAHVLQLETVVVFI